MRSDRNGDSKKPKTADGLEEQPTRRVKPPPTPKARKTGGELGKRSVEVSGVFELSDSQIVVLGEDAESSGPDLAVWTALKESYEEELKHLSASEPRRAARLHYEVGRMEEEVFGDANRALTKYKKALDQDPSFGPNLRALTRRYAIAGAWSEVVKILQRALENLPDETERAALLERCGRIFAERLADSQKALECYKKALALDSGHQPALLSSSELYARMSDYKAQSEMLVRVANATKDPDYQAAILAESAYLREHALNEKVKAVETMMVALKANPRHEGARLGLERLLYEDQRWGELADLYVQEADLTPHVTINVANRFLAGMLLWNKLGNAERAAELLEQACALQPGNLLALLELGELYQENGRWEELVETLERILTIVRDTAPVKQIAALLFRIGSIYQVRLGKTEDGNERFRQALEVSPAHVPARRALVSQLRREQRWEELAELLRLESEIEQEPERRAAAVLQLAELTESKLSNPTDAIDLFEKAHRLGRGTGQAFRALDRLYTSREEWSRLYELYKREAEFSQDVNRRFALARKAALLLDGRLNRAEEAARELERLEEPVSAEREVLLDLSRMYERLGRWTDLIAVLEKEVALSTDGGEICSLLCYAGSVYETRVEDAAKARGMYERVLEVDPGHLDALQRLARVHHREGRWDELAAVYRKEQAVSRSPSDSADILYRVGQLLETKLADVGGAIEAYREALKHDGTHLPAQDSLAGLLRRATRWNELLEVLEQQASGDDPVRVAMARLRAGLILQDKLDDFESAAKMLQEASKTEATSATAQLARERLFAVRGDFTRMAELLEECARDQSQLDPSRCGLRLVSVLRHHKKDLGKARAWCKSLLETEGPNVETLLCLVELNRKGVPAAQLAESIQALAAKLSDPASSVALLKQKGAWSGVQTAEGTSSEAEVSRRILEYAPADMEALETVERNALERGDDSAIAQMWRHEVNHVPQQAGSAAVAYLRLGDVLWRLGRPDDAALAYGRALEFDPKDLPALRSLRILLQLRGEQQQVAERLFEEAELCMDEQAAIMALTKAGDIWLIEFLDPTRAEQAYMKVFERDPTHDVAFQRLASLVTSREGYEDLAALYKIRLSKTDRAQRPELLAELALLYRNNVKNIPAAVSCYEDILSQQPDNLDALGGLKELYAEQRRWREVAEVLEKLVARAKEAETREDRLLELATVLKDRLHEDQRALKILEEILSKSADRKDALEVAVALDMKLGNWSHAAELLQKLADTAQPVERARHLIALAELSHRRLNQPERAQEHLVRAAALCLLAPQAIEALERFFFQRNDPKGYESLLDRVLQEASADRPGSIALRLSRARNLSQRLLKPEEAERQVQIALEQNPESVDARLELGALHLWGDNAGLALAEYQAAMERDPVRPEVYRGLMQVFEQRGELDRARCAAQVLVVLGQANEAEKEAAEAAARAIEGAPSLTALHPEMVARFMAPREEVAAARELLKALSPYLHNVFPQDLEAKGIRSTDELPFDHPQVQLAAVMAKRLGVGDLRMVVDRRKPARVLAVPGPRPVLVLGSDVLAHAEARVLAFYVARELSGLPTGTAYLEWADLRELELTLSGVVYQFDKGYGRELASANMLNDRGKAVLRHLPRKVRRTLEEPALQYANAGAIGMVGWREAARKTAVRVGLCCCGDLKAAIDGLRAEGSNEDEEISLCIFNVSARYAEARKVFGVGF